MHLPSREPSQLRLSARCCAKTRAGLECQAPAVSGKKRCRMHGGGRGSGAPKGEANGQYRTGLHTAEAVAFRRSCSAILRASRAMLAEAAE